MVGPVAEAALLGIVQGVCEFLPVSSEGHRALAALLFRIDGSPGLEVLLRVATLASIVMVLWPEVTRTVVGGVRFLVAPSRFGRTPGAQDALTLVLASVPAAALAVWLRAPAEHWMKSPLVIGLGLLATTAALVLAQFALRGQRERLGIIGALLLGVAQGVGVIPGISPSGSTLAAALLLGLRPLRAFELSILSALPALAVAIALDLRDALGRPFPALSGVVGALVTLLLGTISLLLLRYLVVRGRLGWFAFWVGPLALATLALGLAWPA